MNVSRPCAACGLDSDTGFLLEIHLREDLDGEVRRRAVDFRLCASCYAQGRRPPTTELAERIAVALGAFGITTKAPATATATVDAVAVREFARASRDVRR